MANYNDNAIANAEKGWYVFPVQGKLPYEGFMWKDLSSNDPEVVAMWIMDSRYTGCNWAVDLSKSGKTVIDIDQHPDKPNGFETAKRLGFTTESDYSYPSVSGNGQHNWYDGTYKQANGLYPGIDRKSGEGAYVVAPYELPYLDDIYQPVPKEYAIERIANELGKKYEGTVKQWLESYWGLPTHPEVGALIADFAIKGISGNELVFKIIVKLVYMALEGKGGVPEAIEQLEKIWMKSPHSSGDPKQEWDRALARAITGNGGGLPEKSEEEENEALMSLVERKKLNREADAIVEAMYHQGGQRVDLNAPDQKSMHLIKDFFVEGGINVLFGNSNTGKTFAYIDMWASACMLQQWQGFSAKPFKALFVLGEGAHDFKKRASVWCDYHEVQLEDLLKYAVVWDGGVLSSLEERKNWKEAVDKEKIEAVFWDTWSAVAGLENEDAAGPTSITLNNARSLGLHLTHIFIHHPPLSKENDKHQRMRGSSALFNRADAVINLAVDEEFASGKGITPAEGTNWLRMSTEAQYGGKKRSGRRHTLTGLYFIEKVYSVDEFGESETALVMDRELSGISRDVRDVLNILSDKEMTVKQFKDEWNHVHPNNQLSSDQTIRARLDAAVKSGQILKLKDPNSQRGSVYKAAKLDGIFSIRNSNYSSEF